MLPLKFIDSQDALGHHPIYIPGDTTYVDCFPFYCTFYTNLDIAKQCIDSIDITKYDAVVEPSAGAGAFYNQINHKNKIGVDLEPKCDGVIKQDFLKWGLDEFFPRPKVLTIGNPPFGRQGSLAQKFIKHASVYSNTIAFILPRGFKKRSVYDRVPLNFWNVNEIDIPENSISKA